MRGFFLEKKMDEMIDPVDIANAKIDLEHIGEGGNEDKVVTPRYGIPFKSLPMVSRLGQEGFTAAIQKIEDMGGYISAATLTELNTRTPAYNYQLARVDETGDEYRWDPNATPAAKWVATGKNYLQYLLNILNANQWLTPKKIVAGDNFNNFTKQGIYFHWGANLTSAQVTNAPLYVSGNLAFGVLVVYNPDPSGAKNPACTQTFHPYNDNFAPFHRKVLQTTSDFPSTWGSIVTRATQYTYIEALTTGQDVLQLTPGRYNIPLITIGDSLLNMPTVTVKFGRIEVDYSATTGYKIVRFIPYGRDTFEYVNKSYETGWSGWKTIKDHESLKAEFDSVYATKTVLASAIAESLNNITQDKYFGKQFTASELNGSALWNTSPYVGYNNNSGAGGVNFNHIKANMWCTTAEPIQYRVYYGAKVQIDFRGGSVPQANVNSPDYSGVCRSFPTGDSGAAQEIQLDQVISIPPNTPFVIVFRSETIKIINLRYFGTATGNLESRGFNISSSTADWGAAGISVTSIPNPPTTPSAFVSAGFQLLLKLSNSGGVTPTPTFTPKLILPPKIYVMEGIQGHIYPEHVLLQRPNVYEHNINCTRGRHMERGWLWEYNPSTPDPVGEYSLTWELLNPQTYELLTSGSTVVKVIDKNAKNGTTLNINTIGDSTVVLGFITQRLLDIAVNDVMKVNLIGTRGSGLNKHEGRGGYTINDFTTAGRTYYQFTVSGVVTSPALNSTIYAFGGSRFLVQEVALTGGVGTITCSLSSGSAPTNGLSGTLTKDNSGVGDATITFSNVQSQSGNPFWNAALETPAIDYQNYLTVNSFPTPDVSVIKLGINDTFGFTSDPAVVAFCGTGFPKLDTLIAAMKAANPNMKIILMTNPSYANQDAFGIDYACGQTSSRAKRNIITFNEELIKYYGPKTGQNIFIVGSGYNVDSFYNYPSGQVQVNSHNNTMVTRQANGVHLAASGGQQEGDQLFLCAKDI